MALFDKLRRGQKPPRGSGERSARVTIGDLGDRLAELRESVAAPEDALEPALALVVEAMGACAGAICLYDVRQCILRLTTEVGLSDEGCRHLRTVRRADPGCWDIPLHGLLNRRAYLIESASRNRYVPRLVPKRTSVTTVICLPLFAGMTPLGSLVLVAAAPRIFHQRDIELLWTPIKQLSAGIEQIRRQVTVSTPSGDIPSAAPAHIERSEIAAERDRLLSELAARRTEGERLAAALEEQVASVARLRSELEKVLAERNELKQELEIRPALAGGDEVLAARLGAMEREQAELREALARSEAQRVDLEQRESELEAARAEADRRAAEASDRVRAASEGEAGLEREVERVRRELEAEVARAAEATRAAESARAEAERTAADAQAESRALTDRATTLERELEEARATEAHAAASVSEQAEEVVRLERQLNELRETQAHATARLGTLDDELTIVRSERDQARQAEQAQAIEVGELRTTIATLTAERDEAVERARTVAALEAARDAEAARRADLEKALAEEREARARLEVGVTEGQAKLEAATVAASQSEATADALRRELEALRETVEALQEERAQLAEARDAAAHRLADLEGMPHTTIAMSTEGIPDPAAEDDETVTVISVPPEPLEPLVEVGPMPLMVVLDTDQRWKDIEIDGYQVYVAAPDTDAAAAIAALDPARVVANLSAGVVNTLGALRKAGCSTRFWGCIADPEGDGSIVLGLVEPVIPPLDPDVIIGKLGPYVARGSRIVTAGADVDALMSLRQALARKRVSVSMAWDAKQAVDLMHQAKPDALIIDLDLPKQDGYAIVRQALEMLDPVPYMLLVGGRVRSGESFARVLGDMRDSDKVIPRADVLARIVERSDAMGGGGRKPRRIPFGGRGRPTD